MFLQPCFYKINIERFVPFIERDTGGNKINYEEGQMNRTKNKLDYVYCSSY